MSIDGLMPPDLVKEPVMIGDFSAYGVFAQYTGFLKFQRGFTAFLGQIYDFLMKFPLFWRRLAKAS
jgi:hypothetical protein